MIHMDLVFRPDSKLIQFQEPFTSLIIFCNGILHLFSRKILSLYNFGLLPYKMLRTAVLLIF